MREVPLQTDPVRRVCSAAEKEIASSTFISHKGILKSLCKSQFPHKFVNVFFILLIVKDKLTDLWGS